MFWQNSVNAQISDVMTAKSVFKFLINQKIINQTIFFTTNRLINCYFLQTYENILFSHFTQTVPLHHTNNIMKQRNLATAGQRICIFWEHKSNNI